MHSSTKSQLTTKQINNLVSTHFPAQQIEAIIELTDGYFNNAYRISFIGYQPVILKIAPTPMTQVMTYEHNILQTEVDMLELVKQATNIPVPAVLAYDFSRHQCPSAYFFMEEIIGTPLNKIAKLHENIAKDIFLYQLGQYNFTLNQLTNTTFGYPGEKKLQANNWFDCFYQMIVWAIQDRLTLAIPLSVSDQAILELLKKHKYYFEAVESAQLVHWDLWAGNVFVDNKQISGIIDFERCLWGDPLLEVGFRSHQNDRPFLAGYGKSTFSAQEQIRIRWYDLYLYLIVAQEGTYRRYQQNDFHSWANGLLKETYDFLLRTS
ncbi:Fructosamine-3-kinase [Amphibacillus marinus]|uniref:Fructosamine-3-kinase n=1 Tax=Amphibacillus marinus TaxID=872970 RepID=A0A1H8SMK5_9BACI|nr:aminoglycoside phosphotransferase family protein [Amphibacillus marinus]SEO79433.1 Fructosamine-3-kinase [Amphibacillus marinus]